MVELARMYARVMDHEFVEDIHPDLAWSLWEAVKERTLEGKLTPMLFGKVDGGLRSVSVEVLVDASRNFIVEIPRSYKATESAQLEILPHIREMFAKGKLVSIPDAFTEYYRNPPREP